MPNRRKPEQRAIVLAAGTGSRLVNGGALPKPLMPAAGVPLVVRVLRALQDEGIREAVIVLGHHGDLIRRALVAEPSLGLSLTFVENERFTLKNGVSLLAAQAHVVEGTLLTMADHLYSPEIVRKLRAMDLPRGACALAVDYDAERCFDLDDATKVRVDQGRIVDIGKELGAYNAIDTGVFRIGPDLVDELARLYEANGDCSLSEGVRALAARGAFHACDAGDARWIDVDTPAALQRAEAMIQVFGDTLGDEPATPAAIDPESVELFAPSWVRAALPYREDHLDAASPRPAGRDEVAFPPSPRVVDALLSAVVRGNRYPRSAAMLREQLGRREGLDADHVLLFAGAAELIDLTVRTFVGPGEEVLISAPAPVLFELRTRAVGGIPVPLPAADECEIDVPALIAAVTERTKLVFLCTPTNPTGNRAEEAAIRRVLRLGLPTAVDEAYHDVDERGSSLAYLLHEFPNTIFLRTFSKAFGLAGMRLAYTLAHPAVTRLLARVKVPSTVPGLAIAAASAALDGAQEQPAPARELGQGLA